MRTQGTPAPIPSAVRVFISYAHESDAHIDAVRRLVTLLRSSGIDAHWDMPAAEAPRDWTRWIRSQIRTARYVLVIASPQYKLRAEGNAPIGQGRGVAYEGRLIEDEFYADPASATGRLIAVLLPGFKIEDIPTFMKPYSTTHYQITDYTQTGAEPLLRLLLQQPREALPPLGPPLQFSPSNQITPALRRRLADRESKRNIAMLQSDIRQVLLSEEIGLSDEDLGAPPPSDLTHQRRIVIDSCSAAIDVYSDLRSSRIRNSAIQSTNTLLSEHQGEARISIQTDGYDWSFYAAIDENPQLIDSFSLGKNSQGGLKALAVWLEAILGSRQGLEPTPTNVSTRLGANSPTLALHRAQLNALYRHNRHRASLQIKRALWGKLLATAQGANFEDQDSLFMDHTLLVAMADVIGHAVVGFDARDLQRNHSKLMSGELFARSQIRGVIEADFFDWISDLPGGAQFMQELVRRLIRFNWNAVDHDVLKSLYQSIITVEVRRKLGEYYTPDWLAKEILAATVRSPLDESVLDASCGSGTFLFHSIRRFLMTSDEKGITNAEAILLLVHRITGIDVHPVAVILARVTYLLAIGVERLAHEARPPFSVPVYLGDSLHWNREETLVSYTGLSISTAPDHELFADPLASRQNLLFPESAANNTDIFDTLVMEFANRASRRERQSKPPSVKRLLRKLGIPEEDFDTLQGTFNRMCQMHDEERDHIWGYYIRNLARPTWLTRPENQVDILVGNPPWLTYRLMTHSQQLVFREMNQERGLWLGSRVSTNQNLSALFVARCIELYLRPGGRFGYVMPLTALNTKPYAGFRGGSFSTRSKSTRVRFGQPWNLKGVKPAFFPVAASVVFGAKARTGQSSRPLTQAPMMWSGRLRHEPGHTPDPRRYLSRTVDEPHTDGGGIYLNYAERFRQGATIVPHMLFFIEADDAGPLGPGAGYESVRSHRSTGEKDPWRNLPSLCGQVESEFIREVKIGSSIMPFYSLDNNPRVLLPWHAGILLPTDEEELDLYPGLASWWREADNLWRRHRSSERLSLIERLDYHRGLSNQYPAASIRVVYSASGMYVASAVVTNPTAVIEHKLYWAAVDSLDEARYLTAVLNSTTLTLAVRPLQSHGEHNPRDFDKHIFKFGPPPFDPNSQIHLDLMDLSMQAEQIARSSVPNTGRFEFQRAAVRVALAEAGVMASIDAIVKDMLNARPW